MNLIEDDINWFNVCMVKLFSSLSCVVPTNEAESLVVILIITSVSVQLQFLELLVCSLSGVALLLNLWISSLENFSMSSVVCNGFYQSISCLSLCYFKTCSLCWFDFVIFYCKHCFLGWRVIYQSIKRIADQNKNWLLIYKLVRLRDSWISFDISKS